MTRRLLLAATTLAMLAVPVTFEVAHAQTWSGAASTTANDGDNCDTNVASQMTNVQALQIDSAAALANSMHSTLPTGGFGLLSCLQGVMQQSGISAIFAPPTLATIENWLAQQVCSEVNTLRNQAMGQLTSAEGGLGTSTSLNLGEVVPGVSLGSVPIGFQMTNGNGLSTNVGSYFSQGTPTTTTIFPGLMQ